MPGILKSLVTLLFLAAMAFGGPIPSTEKRNPGWEDQCEAAGGRPTRDGCTGAAYDPFNS